MSLEMVLGVCDTSRRSGEVASAYAVWQAGCRANETFGRNLRIIEKSLIFHFFRDFSEISWFLTKNKISWNDSRMIRGHYGTRTRYGNDSLRPLATSTSVCDGWRCPGEVRRSMSSGWYFSSKIMKKHKNSIFFNNHGILLKWQSSW